MRFGIYEIGDYPGIIRKTYADGSVSYETCFSDQRDLYLSAQAIHACIGKTVGIATSTPKILTGMTVIHGEENIKRELSASRQLFKCNTIKQRKINDWLVSQGITCADVAATTLLGSALVRVTNPAGQYMDVYCAEDHTIRILDVSEEREAELQTLFYEETNEPETQEWREELTCDESALVEQWDEAYLKAFSTIAQKILSFESDRFEFPGKDPNPVIAPEM